MTDPKQTLTEVEIRQAGLTDWRYLTAGLRARFKTANFATGLRLVNDIGTAAEAADHHPDVTLTYREVRVDLSSHDVGGVTSRDVDLARTVSRLAQELGARSDPRNLSTVELALDTEQGRTLAPFYAALMGGEAQDGYVVDPSGQVPQVWFQQADRGGPGLPEPDHDQRWHLDVWVPVDEAQRRIQAVLDAGGTMVSDAAAPRFWVLADAEGNRVCVCTREDRD